MKIIAVLGSPRTGNTNALFEAFAEGVRAGGGEVEAETLRTKSYEMCRSCEACFKTGTCVVKDDFQELAGKVDGARTFVVVTPVQFGGPSSYMSAFFSRCQQFWGRKYVLKKKDRPRLKEKGAGILISACAGKEMEYFHCVKQISQYVFHSIDFLPRGSLCIPGLEGPRDAAERDGLLDKAKEFGKLVSMEKWDELEW